MHKFAKYAGLTALITYSFVVTIIATFFGTLVWSYNHVSYDYRPQITSVEPTNDSNLPPLPPIAQPTSDVPVVPQITQPTPVASNKPLSPEKSLQVFNILNGLQGFLSEEAINEKFNNYPKQVDKNFNVIPPIQVFFDPRCPYCHKLFDKLDGKVPVHWIPVAALSPVENGRSIVAKLLNERDSNNSTANLKKYFAAAINNTEISSEIAEKYKANIDENYEAMAVMTRQLPVNDRAGVPLIIIPQADGQIKTKVGYTNGDEDEIIKSFGQ